MIPYRLDYTIENVLENRLAPKKQLTKKLTGQTFAPNEAKTIWTKIQDHKWYLSERLGRDVGLLVALLDYFLNIQKLSTTPKTAS